VDILGLTNEELLQRHAWCHEQAELLTPLAPEMSRHEMERMLVTDWDLSAAEAAWVVEALP
jgi:hypothetical protein